MLKLALVKHQMPTVNRNSPNAKHDGKCQIRTRKGYLVSFLWSVLYIDKLFETGMLHPQEWVFMQVLDIQVQSNTGIAILTQISS